VVVLVDEYDKPLMETMDKPELNGEIRQRLKAFYGVLKSADPWLRFVFLTGVTKFSQVSVFSDLNHLQDISLHRDYAELCGITEVELTANFEPELRALGEANHFSGPETLEVMRKYYNGYHFCEHAAGVYNPFSVLNTLSSRSFNYYWFQTGTPTFLIKLLEISGFDIRRFAGEISADPESITDYRFPGGSPIPILYQSGYLTIKNYDAETNLYTLGFPNEEVEYGFLGALLPNYGNPQTSREFHAGQFVRDLRAGNVDAFMTRLRAFFADFPYELNDKTERHYQVIFYLVFKLMGQFIQVEVKSAKGRSDAVVTTEDRVYVFEFKLAGTTAGDAAIEEALRQIDDKGYLIPYTAGNRTLVKAGVVFDPAERNIGGWKTVEA
jgi:hypothetical protein